MLRRIVLRCLLATSLALCAGAPARAINRNATATATVVLPLTVFKTKDMDFGALTVTTSGTAVLDPNANSFATTGGVVAAGGTPQCAQFAGAAGSASVVNIKIPAQPTTLTRVGGTETMTVSNFTLQGQNKRSLAKAQSFTFRVGGTLNVAAAQVQGIYVGTFSVTVDYP